MDSRLIWINQRGLKSISKDQSLVKFENEELPELECIYTVITVPMGTSSMSPISSTKGWILNMTPGLSVTALHLSPSYTISVCEYKSRVSVDTTGCINDYHACLLEIGTKAL